MEARAYTAYQPPSGLDVRTSLSAVGAKRPRSKFSPPDQFRHHWRAYTKKLSYNNGDDAMSLTWQLSYRAVEELRLYVELAVGVGAHQLEAAGIRGAQPVDRLTDIAKVSLQRAICGWVFTSAYQRLALLAELAENVLHNAATAARFLEVHSRCPEDEAYLQVLRWLQGPGDPRSRNEFAARKIQRA